jgi:hypothetical protein
MAKGVVPSPGAWKRVAAVVRHVEGIPRGSQGAVRKKIFGSRPAINGTFPVLVVWSAGSDGDATNYATWTYNVYALADTGHATALTAAAVQPENSPARIVKGPVTKATTDTVGLAYYAADGTTVHLYTCAEKHGTAACT